MKIEKDNACDRVDTCEEACKAANIRAQKAEDEVEMMTITMKMMIVTVNLTSVDMKGGRAWDEGPSAGDRARPHRRAVWHREDLLNPELQKAI